MELEILKVKSIVDEIKSSDVKEFDSHFFIREFIFREPASYGQMLVDYNNVITAHSQIAKFLKNNKNELGIEPKGKVKSETIFGEISECENWEIL